VIGGTSRSGPHAPPLAGRTELNGGTSKSGPPAPPLAGCSELNGGISRSGPPDAPPPLFRSWRALYALVAGVLGLEIVLFWLFMKAFE